MAYYALCKEVIISKGFELFRVTHELRQPAKKGSLEFLWLFTVPKVTKTLQTTLQRAFAFANGFMNSNFSC